MKANLAFLVLSGCAHVNPGLEDLSREVIFTVPHSGSESTMHYKEIGDRGCPQLDIAHEYGMLAKSYDLDSDGDLDVTVITNDKRNFIEVSLIEDRHYVQEIEAAEISEDPLFPPMQIQIGDFERLRNMRETMDGVYNVMSGCHENSLGCTNTFAEQYIEKVEPLSWNLFEYHRDADMIFSELYYSELIRSIQEAL